MNQIKRKINYYNTSCYLEIAHQPIEMYIQYKHDTIIYNYIQLNEN